MSLPNLYPINPANKIDGDIPIELLVYCGCIQYWHYCLVVHNKHSTVYSESSVNIPYEGKPLESRTTCHWKIKVTTNHVTSAWSRPAQWSMAFMSDDDWKAQWIGLDKSFPEDILKEKTRLAARYFRKEFQSSGEIVKSKLYISGLGLYEAYINGEKVGDQVLAPTSTDYIKNVKYNTFDVTGLVTRGDNAIGVVLGSGRFFNMRTAEDKSYPPLPPTQNYGFPKMIFQLEVEYADGSRQLIVSDDSWKVTADGPILANNEFDGEEYDARKEMQGWSSPGFDDVNWMEAEWTDAPGGTLQAQLNSNIKVMETLTPRTRCVYPRHGTEYRGMGGSEG